MLFALIRPVESRSATVEGPDIPVLRDQLLDQAPAGWDMTTASVTMQAGGVRTVVGTFERRDAPTEIEADTMAALEAKVPDGWHMLSVRHD